MLHVLKMLFTSLLKRLIPPVIIALGACALTLLWHSSKKNLPDDETERKDEAQDEGTSIAKDGSQLELSEAKSLAAQLSSHVSVPSDLDT